MFPLRSKFVGRRIVLGARPIRRIALGNRPTVIGRPRPRI